MCRRLIARRFTTYGPFTTCSRLSAVSAFVPNLLNSVTSRFLLLRALTEQSTKLPSGALHRFRSFCEDGSKWPERAIRDLGLEGCYSSLRPAADRHETVSLATPPNVRARPGSNPVRSSCRRVSTRLLLEPERTHVTGVARHAGSMHENLSVIRLSCVTFSRIRTGLQGVPAS